MWSYSSVIRLIKPSQLRNLSTAAVASPQAGIDDFLNSVTSAPVSYDDKKKPSFDSSSQFFHWLKKNDVNSIAEYINAANLAVTVREADRKKVFKRMEEIAKEKLVPLINDAQNDETLNVLRFLMQISPKDEDLVDATQKTLIEKNIKPDDCASLRFETLVQLVRHSENVQLEPTVIEAIYTAIQSRLAKELDKYTDLIVLLNYGDRVNWLRNKDFVEKAEQMIVVMGMGEKCNLLNTMASQKQRETRLLKILSNSIVGSSECLSVSQIVSVTSSLASLSFYNMRIFRKIADDLQMNANVLHKWSDVLTLTDSFLRMRLGDEKIWKTLVSWAIHNQSQGNSKELSRFVSACARLGIQDAKPIANELKSQLSISRMITPSAWLSVIFSLAYFQELEPVLVDSVLNKSFVEEIINSSHEKHDRLRKAMQLLMINECAKLELKNYDGPTVTKSSFERFGIKFDAESIRQARELKYTMNNKECDDVFLANLFKIAPRETHCKPPNVEESGVLVDAYVLPEKETGLLSSLNQWGDRKPKPLFFYNWLQTKQNVEAKDESILCGLDQLGLRLMRANGYQPIVVFKTEFEYCATDIDKLNMLREKIHKN